MMAVKLLVIPQTVVFSQNLIKQEFAAVQTMENHVRPPLIVQTTNCHLMMRLTNAKKWVLDFAQKTNCNAMYVVEWEEVAITI